MRERGSVLALLPAAVMIFIVLGAIAVDGSLTFLAERQLSNLAASIANDAATEGIDVVRFYDTGELVLDGSLVQAVADAAVASSALEHLDDLAVDVEVVAADTVAVTVTARTRSLFSRVLPASVEFREVGAGARAVARRG